MQNISLRHSVLKYHSEPLPIVEASLMNQVIFRWMGYLMSIMLMMKLRLPLAHCLKSRYSDLQVYTLDQQCHQIPYSTMRVV